MDISFYYGNFYEPLKNNTRVKRFRIVIKRFPWAAYLSRETQQVSERKTRGICAVGRQLAPLNARRLFKKKARKWNMHFVDKEKPIEKVPDKK